MIRHQENSFAVSERRSESARSLTAGEIAENLMEAVADGARAFRNFSKAVDIDLKRSRIAAREELERSKDSYLNFSDEEIRRALGDD